jgi:hypothetical protein
MNRHEVGKGSELPAATHRQSGRSFPGYGMAVKGFFDDEALMLSRVQALQAELQYEAPAEGGEVLKIFWVAKRTVSA